MNDPEKDSSDKQFENVPMWLQLGFERLVMYENFLSKKEREPKYSIKEKCLPQELIEMVIQIAPKVNSINNSLVSFLSKKPHDNLVYLAWTKCPLNENWFKFMAYNWMCRRMSEERTIKSISSEFIHLIFEAGYEEVFRSLIRENKISY